MAADHIAHPAPSTGAAQRLREIEPACSPGEAVAFFDSLPPITDDELLGGWKGRELATGHSHDGLLVPSGWYGKRFDDEESVHPLVFRTRAGQFLSVEPRRVPIGLAARMPRSSISAFHRILGALQPVFRTDSPRARLRQIEYRGVVSAAMVYDDLPIIDHFRAVDEDTVLGAMDLRGVPEPYFFILSRDPSLSAWLPGALSEGRSGRGRR